MRRALLILVVAVALPAGAQARPFNADEMRMVELAYDYWGREPTCVPGDLQALPFTVVGAYGRAGIHDGVCRLWIAEDTMEFDGLCTTIAHEYGHLLFGPAHDPVAGAIMSEDPLPTPACARESRRLDTIYNRALRRAYRRRHARCSRRHRRASSRKRCVARAHRALVDSLR